MANSPNLSDLKIWAVTVNGNSPNLSDVTIWRVNVNR